MILLSTKKLAINQQELLLNAGLSFVDYNAIEIENIAFMLSRKRKNIIITSQNGARSFLNTIKEGVHITENCFVVGNKTTALLEKNGLKVTKMAQNGQELAHFIVKNHKNESFTYFCGKQRRDELPCLLKEENINFEEIVTYETHLNKQTFNRTFDGVLFYSPSGIQAYIANNNTQTTAFCIGETTATEARKHFETVIVSNATTIESTIAKAVKYLATGG